MHDAPLTALIQMDNRLHHVLIIPPLLKVIFLALSSTNMSYIRTHGGFSLCHMESIIFHFAPLVAGLANNDVKAAVVVFEALETSSLMTLFMLMAEGWCIIWRSPPGYLAWLVIILVGILFSGQICTYWVHRYFAGLVVLDLIVIFVYLLRSSGLNLHLLRQRFYVLKVCRLL